MERSLSRIKSGKEDTRKMEQRRRWRSFWATTQSFAPVPFTPLLSSFTSTTQLHPVSFPLFSLCIASSLSPLSVRPLSLIFSLFQSFSSPLSSLLHPLTIPSSLHLLGASSSSPRTPVMLARCSVACVDGRPLNGQHVSDGGPLCLAVLLL